MATQTAARPAVAQEPGALNALIVDAIQDIKGQRVVAIDLRAIDDSPADHFIVCQGESHVQVRAIAENVRRRLRDEAGERSRPMEGLQNANWVCLDYFDTVVHIFSPDARDFYDLEGLWSDAPSVDYTDA